MPGKLIWSRLKFNQCPKCKGSLSHDELELKYTCNNKCGFEITDEVFDGVVNSMYSPRRQVARNEYDDNLSGLNNL